ncbi:MAG: hypothetical protein V2A72_00015 [Candidatus Omnitrophota bacterium]
MLWDSPKPMRINGNTNLNPAKPAGLFILREKKFNAIFAVLLVLYLLMYASVSYAAVPTNVSISPNEIAAYPEQPVSFTAVYSDDDGYANVSQCYLNINITQSDKKCFYGLYDTATNYLYLRKDDGSGWVGSGTPGKSKILQNSYSKLDCGKTSVTKAGNTITITWSVMFKETFMGEKNLYMFASDKEKNNSTWQKMGTCYILTQPIFPPAPAPTVTDDGDYTTRNTQLHAQWKAYDAEYTNIIDYNYFIQDAQATPVASDKGVIYYRTQANDVTVTGLKLEWGKTYYFGVKAQYSKDMWTDLGFSNGILAAYCPSAPVVIDDGDFTNNGTQLHAQWRDYDATYSWIIDYYYYIKDKSGKVIANSKGEKYFRTQGNEVTVTGLKLTSGMTYYFAVKAQWVSGKWTSYGYSDGITYNQSS